MDALTTLKVSRDALLTPAGAPHRDRTAAATTHPHPTA